MTSGSPGASELMSNFRELHSQGGLSDEEYRTIKAMLAQQVENELSPSTGTENKLKASGAAGPIQRGPADKPA